MSLEKRVKTPVILQMEAVECGAAALAIVLAHYKKYVSLEELRYACGVSRDGSKAINMLRAARTYGLNAEAAQSDLDALPELTYPCIVFWEFNHFVVVEGYDQKFVYINDPALGAQELTYDEFSRGYTGVVLLFEPGPEFTPSGDKDSLWASFKPRLEKIREAFTFIIIASLSLTIPNLVIAGFAKIFFDDILINHVAGWLLPLIWGMLLTALLRAALTWIRSFYLLRLQLKLFMTMSAQFFWHVLRLPMTFFSQRYTGDVCSRLSANNRITSLISNDMSSSVANAINMVLYALFMLLFDWMLTFIGLVMNALSGLVFWFISEHIANSTKNLLQEQGKLTGVEMVGLQGIETLKASGVEDDYFQRWAGYHAKTINYEQIIQAYNLVLNIATPLIYGVGSTLVLAVGAVRIMHGHLTIGSLIGFQTLLAAFSAPMIAILGLANKLQSIRGDLARLNDVLCNKLDPQVEKESVIEEAQTEEKLAGQLEFHNVRFGYSPLDPPLFDGINFLLKPGKSLAIVGSSGCGKSTLAKLACGLYLPWSGDVLLDGKPYLDHTRALIANTIAFVDQDIFLFESSLRNNLTLWDTSISHTELERAIKEAELSDLETNRSLGLGSQVLTEGINFSGGQKQQIELARALVKNPNLLILDEATASLDAVTESKIMDNIKKRNCSMLIIAHRLSTVRYCDEIIVLDHGKIVQQGTHDYLSQQEGMYKRLLLELSNAE